MLRITIQKGSGPATLKLEGKLAGPWVEELKDICRSGSAAEAVLVDLIGVSFVDASGKDLLAQMYQGGADFIADSPLMKQVVDFGLPPYEYYTPAVDFDEVFRKTRADAREQLQEFAKSQTRSSVEPVCFVQEGAVADSILYFAEAEGVDLIVMGTHGRKGFDRVTLGSVAEKVLRKAPCPVLVVRKPKPEAVAPEGAQSSFELRRVIFCTDFSDPSQRALEYALSAAAEFDAELTLLHVLDDIPRSANIEEAIAAATK